ncbi:MAG: hypothetical protein SVO26_08570 [Chloroflexota bacterium]|nr:hypothetical protein [Chloroflexota bacterium]
MASTEKPAIGKITSGVNPNSLVLRTIDFVYTQLPAWRDDPNRPAEQSEKKLNSQLCKFLDSEARNNFPMVRFNHEEAQTGRSSVDISASPVADTIEARTYSIYDPITVFECKRLPAPARAREKEYVTGGKKRKKGGIQRFKLGLHGTNHNIAAMIGYLQGRSPSDWYDEINKWIIELSSGTIADVCSWNISETIEEFEEHSPKGIARGRSTHSRRGSTQSDEIMLCHLWITMHR